MAELMKGGWFMDEIKRIGSALQMKELYFSTMQVLNTNPHNQRLSFNLSHKINYYNADNNPLLEKVEIITKIEDSDKNISIQLTCIGVFELIDDEGQIEKDIANDILQKNTVAIMYPFIRSQVSLLSTQPGMQPILIPPIDVNVLVKENNKAAHS